MYSPSSFLPSFLLPSSKTTIDAEDHSLSPRLYERHDRMYHPEKLRARSGRKRPLEIWQTSLDVIMTYFSTGPAHALPAVAPALKDSAGSDYFPCAPLCGALTASIPSSLDQIFVNYQQESECASRIDASCMGTHNLQSWFHHC